MCLSGCLLCSEVPQHDVYPVTSSRLNFTCMPGFRFQDLQSTAFSCMLQGRRPALPGCRRVSIMLADRAQSRLMSGCGKIKICLPCFEYIWKTASGQTYKLIQYQPVREMFSFFCDSRVTEKENVSPPAWYWLIFMYLSVFCSACKRVLSEKAILAWIMKSCLEELKECDVSDIAEGMTNGILFSIKNLMETLGLTIEQGYDGAENP